MFFDDDRILAVREMILADDADGRRAALAKILPMQREDFVGSSGSWTACRSPSACSIRRCTSSCPTSDDEIAGGRAQALGVDVAKVCAAPTELHEANPMLGHRGCRLGITYPEIYEMQARAIFEAAVAVAARAGETVMPEIMIPLVGIGARAAS